MKYLLRLIIPACAVFFSTLITAEEHDSGTWSTLSWNRPLNQTLSGNFIFQTRIDDDFAEVDRYLLRPSISFKGNSPLVWTLGYDAHFIQTPASRVEHRSWQQVAWNTKCEDVTFLFRFRLEERYIEGVDDVAFRPRILAGITRPLPGSEWKMKISEEVLLNLNDVSPAIQTGYDQSRFFIGAGRPVFENVQMELGYQMQHVNSPRADLINHFLMVGFAF